MRDRNIILKIKEKRNVGKLGKKFSGKDLVRIGIKPGTAWTYLWKHCRGTKYPVNEYFIQNPDGSYSLMDE